MNFWCRRRESLLAALLNPRKLFIPRSCASDESYGTAPARYKPGTEPRPGAGGSRPIPVAIVQGPPPGVRRPRMTATAQDDQRPGKSLRTWFCFGCRSVIHVFRVTTVTIERQARSSGENDQRPEPLQGAAVGHKAAVAGHPAVSGVLEGGLSARVAPMRHVAAEPGPKSYCAELRKKR
jgi:hypothetical protein